MDKDKRLVTVEQECAVTKEAREVDAMKRNMVVMGTAEDLRRMAEKYGDEVSFLDALAMERASEDIN